MLQRIPQFIDIIQRSRAYKDPPLWPPRRWHWWSVLANSVCLGIIDDTGRLRFLRCLFGTWRPPWLYRTKGQRCPTKPKLDGSVDFFVCSEGLMIRMGFVTLMKYKTASFLQIDRGARFSSYWETRAIDWERPFNLDHMDRLKQGRIFSSLNEV